MLPYRLGLLLLLLFFSTCQRAQLPAGRLPEMTEARQAEAWECIKCEEKFSQRGSSVMAVVWTGTRIPENKPVIRLRAGLDNPGYPYALLTYSLEGGVGGGNHNFLRPYVINQSGDTITGTLLPLSDGVVGDAYLPLDNVRRIVEVGILKTNGGNTYAKTTRERVRIYGLRLSREARQKPPINEPADAWLAAELKEAAPGSTLDFRGDTFLLEGTILVTSVRDVTILGGVFYSNEPRFNNKGNRADFFRITNSSNVTFDGTAIYGTRYGDYPLDFEGPGQLAAEDWISRHYEPGRGLVNRLDVSGTGQGQISLYMRNDSVPFLVHRLRLSADTVPVYFHLPDRNARIRVASTFDRAHVEIHGRVRHKYSAEFSSGFYVSGGAKDITIRNAHVENVMGDGLQVDRDARNTRVSQLTVIGASRQGASVNGGFNTYLEDLRLENTGRAGLDVEPYSKDSRVNGLTVRNLVTGNHNFTSFIANNWGQVMGLDLDGLTSFGEMDGTWLGGANGGVIRNVKGFNFDFDGANCTLENIEVTGALSIDSGKEYPNIPGLKSGRNTVRNFTVNRRNSSASYILRTGNDQSNTLTDGRLRTTEDYKLELYRASTTAYLRGNGQLKNVTVEDYERYFPNMILDGRRTKPLITAPEVRMEIGARFATTEKGGTLRPGQTYYYMLQVVPRGQQPYEVMDASLSLPKGANSLKIPVKNLADPGNGYVYHEFHLYRGTSPGVYDTVFHIRPSNEICGLNNSVTVVDRGNSVQLYGGNTTNNRFFGYPRTKGQGVVYQAEAFGKK